MGSQQKDQIIHISNKEEEDFLRVMQLPSGIVLPMVLKAAIELDLFQIMAKSGPNAQLSAAEIASNLPTKNPEAPVMLDRMMRFLANSSFLGCSVVTDEDGSSKRLYNLASICKNFLPNEDGVSLAPLSIIPLDKVQFESWYVLHIVKPSHFLPFFLGN